MGPGPVEPQAAEGLQPVVCFVDRVPVPVKAVNKTFFGPVIKVIGWVERDKVPGWASARRPSRRPRPRRSCPRSSAPAPADACSQEVHQGKPAKAKQGRGPKPGARRSARGFHQ